MSGATITINEPRINERIRVPEVRLVGPQGEQVGIVRIEDALRLAQEADLDLVEVAPDARPPVVKLMDYGKFKYEAAMKAREARRNQVNTEIKEMRFGLKIDEHDYETKKGHVLRFLKGGDKVKLTILFRGREQSRPEMGRRMLMKLAEEVQDFAVIENAPSLEGRRMSIVLGPLKKKADAKEEQRREREARSVEAKEERAARRAPKADGSVGDDAHEELAVEAGDDVTEVVEASVAEASVADAPVEDNVEAEPAAAKAAPAKAAAKPAAAKPAAAKPVAAKPVAKPAATPKAPAASAAKSAPKPVAAKPAVSKPAAKPAPKAKAE